MDELDYLLKDAIKDEVIPSEEEINSNFEKFKANLVNTDNKKYYLRRFNYMNFKKTVVISMCCLMCLTTILFSSSSSVRAAALNAIDNIKSIFVVEYSGDDLMVVQKPTNEVKFSPSVGTTTFKSDAELEELLGYKVIHPQVLNKNYKLRNRSVAVGLRKEIPYDLSIKMQQQILKAVDNQDEFSKLSEYSPFRFASSFYDKENISIYICTSPSFGTCGNYPEKEEIKIGDIKGYWCKYKYPDYAHIEVDGMGQSDFSTKPTIKERYILEWINNDIFYSLSTLKDSTISKEEAIKIAKEFQAAQPK